MTAPPSPMVPDVQARPDDGPGGGRTATRFRSDIQGLRAIAVGLVLLYHAGMPGVSGGYVGVDVFFVISGFLITGLIVREVETTGRLSLRRFYARRARRLLPAAALATIGIAVLTVAVLPVTRWKDVVGDIVASSVYLVNWRLAERSVDYLGAEQAPSPVQHFWSLAVEEQFYVVWPLLIVLLVWWQRRRGGDLRRTLLVGLLAVALPSLAWSVWLTAEEPGRAYFVTTTRLWELAIGGLLVFGTGWFARWGGPARSVVGWSGALAILVAATTYDSGTAFPGAAALLPTLGAAAVIASGVGDRAPGLDRVLGLPVMQDVGAASYSLYLWHWPVLVAATARWGSEDGLPLATSLLAVCASAVPAWAAYRAVEEPLHLTRALAVPWRAAAVGVVCVALGLGSALTVSTALDRETRAAEALADGADGGGAAGAEALGAEPREEAAEVATEEYDVITPHPAEAVDDVPRFDGQSCIAPLDSVELDRCTLGDEDAETVVAVTGDSKMHQWLPALDEIGERRGWRVETYLKSACAMTRAATSTSGRPYEGCDEANDRRIEEIASDPEIDAVLTTQGALSALGQEGDEQGAATERMREGLLEAWQPSLEAGKDVIVMRDNQHPGFDVMECVAEHPDDLAACSFERKPDRGATVVDAAEEASLPVVDMDPWICPTERCPAVIGNVLVYRTGSHLTATYVRSATPYLERELVAAGLP